MWWIGVGMAIVGAVVAHAIFARVAPARNTVILSIVGALSVGLMLVAWAGWTFGPVSSDFVSAAVTYAAFCELYLFMFTLALSSVSANILVRLAAGPKDRSELDSSYDSRGMVEQRLARMQAAGLIVTRRDHLSLTFRGRAIVKAYRLLRSLFRHV
jgi:hypothetical protein